MSVCQPSSKWYLFSNQGRIRQGKERVGLCLLLLCPRYSETLASTASKAIRFTAMEENHEILELKNTVLQTNRLLHIILFIVLIISLKMAEYFLLLQLNNSNQLQTYNNPLFLLKYGM